MLQNIPLISHVNSYHYLVIPPTSGLATARFRFYPSNLIKLITTFHPFFLLLLENHNLPPTSVSRALISLSLSLYPPSGPASLLSSFLIPVLHSTLLLGLR